MANYTIKNLVAVSGTTERAVRQILTTNHELKMLVADHKTTVGNRVYYDETIYQWFVEHYKNRNLVAHALAPQKIFSESADNPDTTAPIVEENRRLSAELEDLKAKYAALQADFEKVNDERAELLRQNGLQTDQINHILLLLSQEKAEKQALLPPPHKTIGERIKSLFRKTDGE